MISTRSIASALLAVCLLLSPACGEMGRQVSLVGVWFSPGGDCTEAIVQQVDGAAQEVLVQAYGFTSRPIASALQRAQQRGVKVRAICDRTAAGQKGCVADELAKVGVDLRIDGAHPIAHNKVMVIDRRQVVTGSFNFSDRAERNAENVLIVEDHDLAERYRQNWEAHWAHSSNPQPLNRNQKNER